MYFKNANMFTEKYGNSYLAMKIKSLGVVPKLGETLNWILNCKSQTLNLSVLLKS